MPEDDRGRSADGRRERRAAGPPASAGRPGSAPAAGRDDVIGVFRRAAGGYGFVHPLNAAAGSREGDVHVAQSACLDAVNGDTVRVRLSRGRDFRRPGPSGEIVEVGPSAAPRRIGERVFLAAPHKQFAAAPAASVVPILDAVSDEQAVLLNILEVGHIALRRAKPQPSDRAQP